jgi:hypothetical protein
VPPLRELGRVVADFAAGRISFSQARAGIDAIFRRNMGHHPTRIGCDAAVSILADLQARIKPANTVLNELARRYLFFRLEHQFFGPARPKLIGTRFLSEEEERDFGKRVRAVLQPDIDSLAAQILEGREPAKIRVRSQPRPKFPSTAEQLHQPLNV